MTKLTIGIGEDFPVEENAGEDRGCHFHHHHHHHGHELHERWHRWWHERFRRPEKDDKNKNGDQN